MSNSITNNLIDPGLQQITVSEEAEIDFVTIVSEELVLEIFSYLNSQALARCQRVDKKWQVLASDEKLWKALPLEIAFGKKEWTTYLKKWEPRSAFPSKRAS